MKTLSILSTTTLILAASCQSTSREPARIDNALLSELSPSTMTNVVEARATKDVAEDALAKAERDMHWADEQIALTRSGLKVARTELDEAKMAMVVAEKSGTVSQLERAKREYEYSLMHADEMRSVLSLRKRESEYSKLATKAALEEFRLTGAQVELQKAQAVQELDRVAAKQVPVKDYLKQVRFHETEVQLAQVRLAAMSSHVSDAMDEYEAIRVKAEGLKSSL